MNIEVAASDPAFLYELTPDGVNRWSAKVSNPNGRMAPGEAAKVARLLATAPALLEAAKNALRTLPIDAYLDLREAVAEAEGD